MFRISSIYKIARNKHFLLLIIAVTTFASPLSSTAVVIDSEKVKFRATELKSDLNHPWGLAFLPNGEMLVTERSGALIALDKDGGNSREIQGLPEITVRGQGGLLDVALHPDFSQNQLIYLTYSGPGKGGQGTRVVRGRLQGDRLEGAEVLFILTPLTRSGHHFGSRLVFDQAGYLYITSGDRGAKDRAQDLADHAGSVFRLHDDGQIPADNPFIANKAAKPEIYSYGHRNVQGAVIHPQTGELWLHEHGPQGGDELNRVEAGKNYGWPTITYGVNYGSGSEIGEGTAKAGMLQPLHYWVPSIAPSGLAYYDGDAFAPWKGNFLLGSLKFGLLVRLEMDGDKVLHEERMLQGEFGRVRDVRVGPDGLVYLLTDARRGKLIRLQPE